MQHARDAQWSELGSQRVLTVLATQTTRLQAQLSISAGRLGVATSMVGTMQSPASSLSQENSAEQLAGSRVLLM
jgi:hypothetical protein